jgi:hypothetical protein
MELPTAELAKAGALFLVLYMPGGVRVEMSDGKQVALVRGVVKAMLSFAGRLKVFVAVKNREMSKGFNGLHVLVCERWGRQPKGGSFICVQQSETRADQVFFAGIKAPNNGRFSTA